MNEFPVAFLNMGKVRKKKMRISEVYFRNEIIKLIVIFGIITFLILPRSNRFSYLVDIGMED